MERAELRRHEVTIEALGHHGECPLPRHQLREDEVSGGDTMESPIPGLGTSARTGIETTKAETPDAKELVLTREFDLLGANNLLKHCTKLNLAPARMRGCSTNAVDKRVRASGSLVDLAHETMCSFDLANGLKLGIMSGKRKLKVLESLDAECAVSVRGTRRSALDEWKPLFAQEEVSGVANVDLIISRDIGQESVRRDATPLILRGHRDRTFPRLDVAYLARATDPRR